MKNFHVAIIGGGVVGSAIARELSKYKLDVAVFEKGIDVASATSKANSGVIHSGINSKPGSLRAHFCVKGNQMFQQLSENLGFSLNCVGKYVVAKNENEAKELEKLMKVGVKNKVPDLEIHDSKEVVKKEPNVICHSGLWVPTAGIILPYEFNISLAENAALNGVKFFLETEVIGLQKKQNDFVLKTTKGNFHSKIVINSAGLDCRNIVSMIEKPDFKVYPCRGEYLILDKNCSKIATSMIYPIPPKEQDVLGVHITPTVEGNILLGPSAEFVDDPKDLQTTKNMMKTLIDEAKEIIPKIPKKSVIAAYAGMRCKLAHPDKDGWADYQIKESKQNPGMINLLGIESPGLTSAPAIAKEITNMISNHFDLKNNKIFKTYKRKKRFIEMNPSEQSNLIKKDDRWGRIICRCEHITEAEVINALSNPLGARSISSVKYRCRAGMGRCQSGFCIQHIVRILQEDFNVDIKNIKLSSSKSNLFYSRVRETKDD
jgi:glycerol-3-phosphate dehydrogenase